ncbi:MAG: dUTP diphosphatase [candidate division WOR-3 bacterium]|nr:dUTP diphosphatase [candidate division WOR-3 bacterium]
MKREIKIKINGIFIPEYQTPNASGCDLYANIERPIVLKPGEFRIIPTGICIEIPEGYEAQVRPRSGLAAKYGIGILNAPGTIDADYRGEIKVILFNFGKKDVKIKKGDRIAQLVFAPVLRAIFKNVRRLSKTRRNTGGFGHTGGIE